MPFIVTPKQLALRGELYHQLGAVLAAGLPLINGLETLRKNPPARSFREPLRLMIRDLEQGETFAHACRVVEHWIPSFDTSLLEAGEKSGRLDACCKVLAEYYNQRATLLRNLLAQLGYPLFLFHFAVLLGPFPKLFLTGNVTAYLMKVLGVFAPVYAAVFLLVYACQGRHGEFWRSWMEGLLAGIPLLGTARRDLALARISLALEALINAGVSIIEAWDLAARASGSPRLARVVTAWRPRVEYGGITPGDALGETTAFPELFTNLYRTGEVSGKLDETLRRLHAHYQDEGSRKMRSVADWTPKLVYLVIAGAIAVRIVSFYSNYFKTLNSIMGP